MSWRILQGDALDRLRETPAESVQCCVTSPPYWGLRDYRVKGQLGLEETPEQYVAAMVEVFAEVRRVLRSDGTLWLNIGDSYATGGRGGGSAGAKQGTNVGALLGAKTVAPPGCKPKDLVGIPWMLAFALRADGWYLRRDIIWAKPNPMPESVTDRPTSAHEYLFLLTKSPRYFYDAEAIREPATWAGEERERQALGRNKRSVWTIATKPFSDAHFATFPPDLVEPCIRAGTSSKVCGRCSAPWQRVTERIDQGYDGSRYGERAVAATGGAGSGGTARSTLGSSGGALTGKTETLGWDPTCGHADDSGHAVVLDPFAGAATTGLVAIQLGRDFVGVELNPEYVALGEDRIRRWEHDPAGHLRTGRPAESQGSLFEDG